MESATFSSVGRVIEIGSHFDRAKENRWRYWCNNDRSMRTDIEAT
jgi:hypothetical protein